MARVWSPLPFQTYKILLINSFHTHTEEEWQSPAFTPGRLSTSLLSTRVSTGHAGQATGVRDKGEPPSGDLSTPTRASARTYTHTHHLWLPFCQVHNCGITLPPLTPPDVVGYSTCRCECRCEWCACLACYILIFNLISNCNKMAAASPSFQLTTTAATLSFHGFPLALRADRTQSWPPVSDIL